MKAQKVAKERQCKIVYTGLFFYKSPNLKTVCDAGIEDFLSYIDYAEVVVTNSFHGTVFSVLYEKRFLSVKIASTSSRVDSFLEMTGLKTQSVESANDNYSLDNIDFAKAKEVLEIERRKSLDYLQSICNSKS